MDCGCVNTGISIYFQCRILAAKNNVYLKSRESAAEYFGISVSSLANYERGITVPPLDLIMMMADVYGAPQLKNLYCLEQCPLGKQQPVSAEIKTLEAVTVGIIAKEVTEAVVAKIEKPAELVKEQELQQSNSLVERRAKELKILTNEDYEKAAEFGQKIKIQAKVVTDFFKPMKDSAYALHGLCRRKSR